MRERKNSKVFYATRGATAFLWFFVIYKLTSLITLFSAQSMSSKETNLFTGLPEYVVFITISVSAIFIFNSVSLMFSTFDIDEIENFLEEEQGGLSFAEEFKRIFKTPHILTELITTLSLVSVSALIGGFSEIGRIFFESAHRNGWFPLVIITPICFLLFISAKYEARRYWLYLNKIDNLERVTAPLRFYKRFALVFFLYPLLFPYSPLIVFFAFSFVSLLISLFGALTVTGLIVIVILSVLFILVIPALKRSKRSKKLINAINDTAAKEGYRIVWQSNAKEQKNTYKFDLFIENKEFNCLIICTKRKAVPLVFTSATSAYFEHRLGTSEHHISINRNIDFFLPGNGTKIIILNPSPKHVFVTDGIKMQRLSYSDRIWNQTLHDETSFIGAMSRKCLDKYNSGIE